MKTTDKKKPINTVPQGVWESDRPEQKKKKRNALVPYIDLQGNGYPVEKTR